MYILMNNDSKLYVTFFHILGRLQQIHMQSVAPGKIYLYDNVYWRQLLVSASDVTKRCKEICLLYRKRQSRSWRSCVCIAGKQTLAWSHNRRWAPLTLTPPRSPLSYSVSPPATKKATVPPHKSGGCKVSCVIRYHLH